MILMFNPNAALMLISGLHGESFETDRLTTQQGVDGTTPGYLYLLFSSNRWKIIIFWRLRPSSSRALYPCL